MAEQNKDLPLMCRPLSDAEIEQLRELLEVADTVKKEAEYKIALQLVLRTWKNIVLAIAATLGALYLIRDYVAKVWQATVGA